MIKQKPKRRPRIEIRVRDTFIEIDLKFQQICIDKKLRESRIIRDLIKEYVDNNEPVTLRQAKRLDEFF